MCLAPSKKNEWELERIIFVVDKYILRKGKEYMSGPSHRYTKKEVGDFNSSQ